jgi:hypothetical protein
MSLADDLVALKNTKVRCLVGRILDEIDIEDANALDAVIQDRNIASGKISFLLEKYGYKMTSKTIDRHRNLGTSATSRCNCEH